MERLCNIRPLFETGKQHRRRLDSGQAVAARLAAKLSITGRLRRTEDDTLTFQHPRVAPPQRLGLTPGPIEQHDAFDLLQDGALAIFDFALAVDGDNVAVRIKRGDLGRT